MKKILYLVFVLNFIILNPLSCFAVRFHPSITDADVCALGAQYPTVGLMREKQEKVYNGNLLEVNVDSTATLVTVPGLEKYSGSLILASHHAFKNWKPDSDNFMFHLNGNTSKITRYIPAPAEELSEIFLCFFRRSINLQRDFGFAVLEKPIEGIAPSSLLLDNFSDFLPNEVLTAVGYGDAGRLDSRYFFKDSQRRAMQSYVSEYHVISTENGVSASQDGVPLRLEHDYSWDLTSSLLDSIVRGSVENSDSGGPIFMGDSVVGLIKGSGYAVPINGQILSLIPVFDFSDPDKKKIENLKSNNPLEPEMEERAVLPTHFNAKSHVIESLGGAHDWIANVLPTLLP